MGAGLPTLNPGEGDRCDVARSPTMALRDPIAAYNAANNLESYAVRDALLDAGIEAYVIEDNLQVLWGWFGALPEINKPQVWIERNDSERARPVLDEYERLL